MKRLSFILLFLFTFIGCSVNETRVVGGFDFKGDIVEISKAENRILVDDKDKGLVWISLHRNGKITNYEVGQEVVVWVDGGVDDSSPMQAGALNIEITSP